MMVEVIGDWMLFRKGETFTSPMQEQEQAPMNNELIERLAAECGIDVHAPGGSGDVALGRFAALVAEECAKIVLDGRYWNGAPAGAFDTATDRAKAVREAFNTIEGCDHDRDWSTGYPSHVHEPIACEHAFVFQGIVYSIGRQLPGSSARERVYHDRFYCSKCLTVVDKNERVLGNTYERPIAGAMPK